MSTRADGKFSWLHFAMNNASTIALVMGFLWYIGKPHAGGFIVEVVEVQVAAGLTERLETTEANQKIIKLDQQTIKNDQKSIKQQIDENNRLLKQLLQQRRQ